ncbi:MAG: ABC transporter permease [Planctomycetes bacterium]|nr:ABC transporter permease [Planctomycetota bacterium]
MNRWRAFRELVLARFREFYREPEALFWVYGFPLILAISLSYAFSGRKEEPPSMDVQGSSSDSRVQAIAKALKADGIPVEIHDEENCRRRLKSGKTPLVLVPAGGGAIEFHFDQAQVESILARRWAGETLLRAAPDAAKVTHRDVLVQEPGSRYIDFLFPGLIGMNLLGGGLFGLGFVLVDMRVRKLFKRLLATPMRRVDFILAMFAARMIFLIPEVLFLLIAGHLLFAVPIYGNALLLILVIVVSGLTFSSMGLLLGSRTEKTETASGLMNLVMLPMYLLSGVFFSSKRFPEDAQPFIQALPLTQVNDALREVMLEGMSLTDIAWRLGVLLLWTAVCLPVALKWFRWR